MDFHAIFALRADLRPEPSRGGDGSGQNRDLSRLVHLGTNGRGRLWLQFVAAKAHVASPSDLRCNMRVRDVIRP